MRSVGEEETKKRKNRKERSLVNVYCRRGRRQEEKELKGEELSK